MEPFLERGAEGAVKLEKGWGEGAATNHSSSPHVTSQPTTLLHLHDIKTGHITTVEQQKARSQQRNGLGMALVGRPAHIL